MMILWTGTGEKFYGYVHREPADSKCVQGFTVSEAVKWFLHGNTFQETGGMDGNKG